MERIVIHIGLRKTASTFLQHNIFPKISNVAYKRGGINPLSYDKVFDKEVFLISDEDIPGWPYLKGYTQESFFEQFKESLKTIKHIFKDPKLVVCFREPSAFIHSNYKQYLHEGGTVDWEDFFSLNESSLLDKNDFYFSKYVDYLNENFRSEDLFIYDFQSFKKNNQKLSRAICDFINPGFQNLNFDISSDKKANPSVKHRFEGTLIKLNEWDKWAKEKLGFGLQIKLFGKTLNPRVLCQYILPKIFKSKTKRDLSDLKKYYGRDWKITLSKIKKD